MQKTTWFTAMTKALQKHSEFMRPDLADNFPDMEYTYPPPYVVPDGPMENPDVNDIPNNPAGGQYCAITCHSPQYCNEPVECDGSIHFCPPGMSWLECIGNQKWSARFIDGTEFGIQVDLFPELVYPAKVKPMGGSPWNHWPDNPTNKIEVKMVDAVGNECFTVVDVFCRVQDCCDSDEYVATAFDQADPPATIARNSSISVTATGGCPPYTWSVSGTGFTMASASTQAATNNLVADGTACGIALITVTDKCGYSSSGIVQCLTGTWAGRDSCVATGASACNIEGACNATTQEIRIGAELYKYTPVNPSECSYGTPSTNWSCTFENAPEPPWAPSNWPDIGDCGCIEHPDWNAWCTVLISSSYEWIC